MAQRRVTQGMMVEHHGQDDEQVDDQVAGDRAPQLREACKQRRQQLWNDHGHRADHQVGQQGLLPARRLCRRSALRTGDYLVLQAYAHYVVVVLGCGVHRRSLG
ncbi:hypothetical protein PPS11_13841 [Pseudomonas putida S11]|nr:hypothetical protein PPS11_13841 [Pseudomonas putida S11]